MEDIVESTGICLEAEGIDTIGGLVFNRVGTLPRTGAVLDIDGYRITVQRTSRKRIEELLIEPPDCPADEDLEAKEETSVKEKEEPA